MDSANYNGAQRPRYDSNALLMLPAPLSVNRNNASPASSGGLSRSSEDNAYLSDSAESNLRLVPSFQSGDQYSTDMYEAPASTSSPSRYASATPQYQSPIPRVAQSANVRSVTSPSGYTEAHNPFRGSTTSPMSYDDQQTYTSEPEEIPVASPPSRAQAGGRGVRLTDSGPVPGPEGVRRVSRPSGRRPTSQAAPISNQNRYSRSSVYNLPPGAAAPQSNPYGGN